MQPAASPAAADDAARTQGTPALQHSAELRSESEPQRHAGRLVVAPSDLNTSKFCKIPISRYGHGQMYFLAIPS